MQLFSSPLSINQPGLPAFLALRGTTLSHWTSDEQWMCVAEREGDGTKLKKKGKKIKINKASAQFVAVRGNQTGGNWHWGQWTERQRELLCTDINMPHTPTAEALQLLCSVCACVCAHAASQLRLGKPRGVTHHSREGSDWRSGVSPDLSRAKWRLENNPPSLP